MSDEEIKAYAATYVLMYGALDAWPKGHTDAVKAFIRSGKIYETYLERGGHEGYGLNLRAAFLAKWISDHE